MSNTPKKPEDSELKIFESLLCASILANTAFELQTRGKRKEGALSALLSEANLQNARVAIKTRFGTELKTNDEE